MVKTTEKDQFSGKYYVISYFEIIKIYVHKLLICHNLPKLSPFSKYLTDFQNFYTAVIITSCRIYICNVK